MTRFTSVPNTTAVSADHAVEVVFYDLDFSSGHLRCCSADHNLSISGNTYLGFGTLLSDDGFTESSAGVAEQLTLSLTGVDTAIIATVLGEHYHGRSATRYVGWLDESGVLVDTPYTSWEGIMDKMGIQFGQNFATISLVCESIFILWNQARNWMYSDEHHSILMGAGDNFFDQLSAIQDQVIQWGDKLVTVGNNHSGGNYTPGYQTPKTLLP